MNICMVLADRDFPPDIRVEKEARSLISAGHRVIVLCLRTGDHPAVETRNGIEIRRITSFPFVSRKLNSLLFILFFRDLRWKRAIGKLVKEEGIEVLHVHDLPMVGTALGTARTEHLPVIADLHENYPALIRLSGARRRQKLAERLMWPARWEHAERRWGRRVFHLFVVVDEMKERLVAKGIPPEKITVVDNTVDVEEFLSLPVDRELTKEFERHFVITYVGGFSPHRGLDTAIKAMPIILREIPNAKLFLVGDGEMMPKLEKLSRRMGLDSNVVFTGWQPFERVPSFIAASDVCIVPHAPTEQTEASGPHKLYQYMLMGKPLVVSSCRSLRRMVEETGAGVVFRAGDSRSLACSALELKDPAVRIRLGEAGRKSILGKYNWEATSRRLVELYANVAGRKAGRGRDSARRRAVREAQCGDRQGKGACKVARTRRLRVLFLTAWYPQKDRPVWGIFVREHAKAVNLYDDVVVVHLCGPAHRYNNWRLSRLEEETDERFTEGIRTFRLRVMPFPIRLVSDLITIWGAFRAFRRIVAKGFRPQVIHAHIYEAGLPAVLIGKLYGTPVGVTEHYTAILDHSLPRPAVRRARIAFRWADVVTPVSWSLQRAIEAYGVKAQFAVVPNAVDTRLFRPAGRPARPSRAAKRILMVAMLVPTKGVPLLLEAVRSVRARRTDFVVDIAGDGPCRAEYERLASRLGDGVVNIHGFVDQARKIELMQQCDFFVLPSCWENFGVVLIEALACGKPLITTARGGPREFVTKAVGMAVTPPDSRALAEAIDYMLDHHADYDPHELAEYARDRFGHQAVGAKIDAIYRMLLREGTLQ